MPYVLYKTINFIVFRQSLAHYLPRYGMAFNVVGRTLLLCATLISLCGMRFML